MRSIISIEDIILYLRRYWRLSLTTAGILSALLLILLIGRTPLYQSETHVGVIMVAQNDMPGTTIQIPESQSMFMVLNHKLGLTTRSYQEYFYEQVNPQDKIDFLEERGFKKPLVAKGIALVKDAIWWVQDLFNADEDGASGDDWERELFIKRLNLSVLKVDEVKETHRIRVVAKNPNRELAARLANQYAMLYADYLAFNEREKARGNFEFLVDREQEYRDLAMKSRRELYSFRIDNNVLNDSGQLKGPANDEVKRLNEARAKVRVRASDRSARRSAQSRRS